MSGWSIGRYGENAPLRVLPCDTTSIMPPNSFMKWTAPDDSPLSLIGAPLCRQLPKYPDVPPPNFDIMPTSACVYKIFPILSSILLPKQLIGNPLSVPKFAITGVDSE